MNITDFKGPVRAIEQSNDRNQLLVAIDYGVAILDKDLATVQMIAGKPGESGTVDGFSNAARFGRIGGMVQIQEPDPMIIVSQPEEGTLRAIHGQRLAYSDHFAGGGNETEGRINLDDALLDTPYDMWAVSMKSFYLTTRTGVKIVDAVNKTITTLLSNLPEHSKRMIETVFIDDSWRYTYTLANGLVYQGDEDNYILVIGQEEPTTYENDGVTVYNQTVDADFAKTRFGEIQAVATLTRESFLIVDTDRVNETEPKRRMVILDLENKTSQVICPGWNDRESFDECWTSQVEAMALDSVNEYLYVGMGNQVKAIKFTEMHPTPDVSLRPKCGDTRCHQDGFCATKKDEVTSAHVLQCQCNSGFTGDGVTCELSETEQASLSGAGSMSVTESAWLAAAILSIVLML